jgi:hypothetical protein
MDLTKEEWEGFLQEVKDYILKCQNEVKQKKQFFRILE